MGERDLLSGDSTALAILFSQLYIYYLECFSFICKNQYTKNEFSIRLMVFKLTTVVRPSRYTCFYFKIFDPIHVQFRV
jgi:hypothetical protein